MKWTSQTLILSLLPIVSLGCRPVFSVYPDELSQFRIMSIGLEDNSAFPCPVASAVIWSGDGEFHSQAVSLDWSLDGEPLGQGWDQQVCGGDLLSLTVTSPSGESLEGFVSVGDGALPIFPTREAVVVEDTSIEERRSLTGSPVSAGVQVGEASRTHLASFQGSDRVRWMSPVDSGEVLELDVASADILGDTLTLEDGEVVDRASLGVAITSHFVVAVDGLGGNHWGWVDSSFGLDDSVLFRHEGRLIDVSGEDSLDMSVGMLAFTLNFSDGVVEYTDFESVSDLAEQTVTCGVESQPFRLEWINSGRCTTADLDTERVVIEIW